MTTVATLGAPSARVIAAPPSSGARQPASSGISARPRATTASGAASARVRSPSAASWIIIGITASGLGAAVETTPINRASAATGTATRGRRTGAVGSEPDQSSSATASNRAPAAARSTAR